MPPERIRTGGGRFDPAEEAIYFISGGGDMKEAVWALAPAMLYALGEANVEERLTRAIASTPPLTILVDSGIFTMAMDHARQENVHMYEALRLRPQDIDGFDELWDAYLRIIPQVEDGLWGYVELDQGGADVKKANREALEREGLRPIPVYHPLLDGWDYFDELCERYDRVAVGNLAVSPVEDRRRIMRTIWERQRDHPDVWVHLLGVTIGPMTLGYPCHSCDSSTWLIPMTYGKPQSYAHLLHYPPRELVNEWAYDRGQEKAEGYDLAARHSAIESVSLQMMWRQHVRDSPANRFEVV